MDEFDLISKYFAPLAAAQPGALGLKDDAALLTPEPHRDLVVTTDIMVEGIHFPQGEKPDLIARKLLRVNLSDLAAMGAAPTAYVLGLAVPRGLPEDWFAAFAAGLALDQAEFGIGLVGGDTVATDGAMTLSLTALGNVPTGGGLRRSGARPGDLIFVSGAVGDGLLGLACVTGELSGLPAEETAYLSGRYRLPSPRLELGLGLAPFGHACADLSDGLVADLGHICAASGGGAEIELGKVPLSPAAGVALGLPGAPAKTDLLAGGDDYELVFAVAPRDRSATMELAAGCGVRVTEIGVMTPGGSDTSGDTSGDASGGGVRLKDEDGKWIEPARAGFVHFASRGEK